MKSLLKRLGTCRQKGSLRLTELLKIVQAIVSMRHGQVDLLQMLTQDPVVRYSPSCDDAGLSGDEMVHAARHGGWKADEPNSV